MSNMFTYRFADDFGTRSVPANHVEECSGYTIVHEKAFAPGPCIVKIARIIKDGWAFAAIIMTEDEAAARNFIDTTVGIMNADGCEMLMNELDKGLASGEFELNEFGAVEFMLKWPDALMNVAKVLLKERIPDIETTKDERLLDYARERSAQAVSQIWLHSFPTRHPELLEDPQVFSLATAVDRYKALNSEEKAA